MASFPPKPDGDDRPNAYWDAFEIIGLGIFTVILLKTAFDIGRNERWW